MKKTLAILLAVVMCVGLLSVTAFADQELTGMAVVGEGVEGLDWKPEYDFGKMTEVKTGIWEYTLKNVPANAELKVKFADNGRWDNDRNFGANGDIAFGTAVDLDCGPVSPNTVIKTTKACDLKFTVDVTAYDVSTHTGAKLTVAPVTADAEPEQPHTADNMNLVAVVAVMAVAACGVAVIGKKKFF